MVLKSQMKEVISRLRCDCLVHDLVDREPRSKTALAKLLGHTAGAATFADLTGGVAQGQTHSPPALLICDQRLLRSRS